VSMVVIRNVPCKAELLNYVHQHQLTTNSAMCIVSLHRLYTFLKSLNIITAIKFVLYLHVT
jgi:hypothetical protein